MELVLSPDAMTKLDDAINESVASLIRTDKEKDIRAEIVDTIRGVVDIKPAEFNQLVKQRYDDSLEEKIAKLQGVVEMNDKLIEHRRKLRTKYVANENTPESDIPEDEQDELIPGSYGAEVISNDSGVGEDGA